MKINQPYIVGSMFTAPTIIHVTPTSWQRQALCDKSNLGMTTVTTSGQVHDPSKCDQGSVSQTMFNLLCKLQFYCAIIKILKQL